MRHPLKLQRVVNRTVGDKTYYKWQLMPPGDLIEKRGWDHGREISPIDGEDLLKLSPRELARILKRSIVLDGGTGEKE